MHACRRLIRGFMAVWLIGLLVVLPGAASAHAQGPPPPPSHDGDVWWDGLAHNSRDDLYRTPGGAVPVGTAITLRLRTFHDDATAVMLRVWDTTAGRETLYAMERVATVDDPPYGYDYWELLLPAAREPTIVWYRFLVRDGGDEDAYDDDEALDGGWGAVYDRSPDRSFQIVVYAADFQTPAWLQNATLYQIFPDRFANGDPGNDPRPGDPYYGGQVRVREWGALPEGYCRAYEGVACDEEPQGRDFYGGDLQGVIDKLDYLVELGVTGLYLNPIFEAPSNHLYDTSNYYQVDPYLGSLETFKRLLREAEARGIHVILDGVFNHTSSDSVYFDRYGRYRTLGAFESRDSRYYDWYTFSEWPEQYDAWWGFDSLPNLTEIEAVRAFIYGRSYSVARWWPKLGTAGWRLDVAPDKSHEWWREFRPQVKSSNPEAVILGEVWDDASPWLLGDQFDSTMNYRFRRALIGFVNGGTDDPNQGWIRDLNPDQFHAELASIQEDYPPPAFAGAMNLVSSHDTPRILWLLTPGARNRGEREWNAAHLAEGKAKLRLLAALQMTLPGAPTIYYGDEAGLAGDTDPDDRRTYPWGEEDPELLAHYRTLGQLRRQHSYLRTGSFDRLWTHNDDGTYAYGRKDTTGAALVAVNRQATAHDLSIDVRGYLPEGTVLCDGLRGSGEYTVREGRVEIKLAGREAAILITEPGVDLRPPDAPPGLTVLYAERTTAALRWAGVPGAVTYFVYRSPVSGGGYQRLSEVPATRTYIDNSERYRDAHAYYVVTAMDAQGNESARSNEVVVP